VVVPALRVDDVDIVVRPGLVRIAEIFDEYWVEVATLPSIPTVLERLHDSPLRPDIFTFSQRVPDAVPLHEGFRMEWGNFAVLTLSTYDHWFQSQIPATTRRNVRASEKRGVTVRACQYDDSYVRGIKAIFDETPVRAGRRYWHYGKDLEVVRAENSTYEQRSTFLGAFIEDVMVGYVKVVWDARTAAIMQILSITTARDQRVNNAMMAEVVKEACRRGITHLVYESFDYGKKSGDSLTRFKQSNGFQRMDVPRYFVPLTRKGEIALRLGLHRDLRGRIPEPIAARWRALRTRWYERRVPAGESV
jgi:hypothetical protein